MDRRTCFALGAAALLLCSAGRAQEPGDAPEPPLVTNAYGSSPMVVVPMVFPVLAEKVAWSDTFGAPRDGGRRRHQGQDLPAPRMTPVLAAFDGTVFFTRTDAPNAHNILSLRGDSGWSAWYLHLNNDRPGTDDGLGSLDYAFAPGLEPGDRVVAGQFLAWVGDSGNAESTGPHLHFELQGPQGVLNAAPSLRHAARLTQPRLSLPLPELKPDDGEVRIDGALRSVDVPAGLLCVDLIATQAAGAPAVPCTAPSRRWIRLEGVRIASGDGVGAEIPPDALPRGTRLAALVKYRGPTTASPARRVALHLPSVPPGPAPAAGSAPIPGPETEGGPALPFVRRPDQAALLVERVLEGKGGGRAALSGGWNESFLFLTCSASGRFEARVQVDAATLRISEEGVWLDDAPLAGSAVLATRGAGGAMALHAMIPLRKLPIRSAAAGERRIRLRAALELSGGSTIDLPEGSAALPARLAGGMMPGGG